VLVKIVVSSRWSQSIGCTIDLNPFARKTLYLTMAYEKYRLAWRRVFNIFDLAALTICYIVPWGPPDMDCL